MPILPSILTSAVVFFHGLTPVPVEYFDDFSAEVDPANDFADSGHPDDFFAEDTDWQHCRGLVSREHFDRFLTDRRIPWHVYDSFSAYAPLSASIGPQGATGDEPAIAGKAASKHAQISKAEELFLDLMIERAFEQCTVS